MKREEKETEFARERVKEVIAECFIKGWTKVKTIERVQRLTGEKMYPKKLNRMLAEILATWTRKGIKDKVLMRVVELKKIDVREAELWQAWVQSLGRGSGCAVFGRVAALFGAAVAVVGPGGEGAFGGAGAERGSGDRGLEREQTV